MKMSKTKFCGLLLGVCVLGLGLDWCRTSHGELLVHVIDKQTRRPATNVVVKIREIRGVPLLSSFRFFLSRLPHSSKDMSVQARDGSFRIGRISRYTRLLFAEVSFESEGTRLDDILIFSAKGFRIDPGICLDDCPATSIPDSMELTIPIDLAPKQ
jgi:hypothetical protein